MFTIAVALLARLVAEAAAASPEVAQARADVEAYQRLVSPAGALPDPTLSLGIQNDGFKDIEIGKMGTSFVSIGLTQPLYWPGKRELRTQVASLDAKRAEAQLSRALLDVEGRTRRAYVALLLARSQQELLDEQDRLWTQAEQTARSRYESGQVPQSDLLRAQLERARLQQRRFAIEAALATGLAELNRLRAHPLDEPIEAAEKLADLPEPPDENDAEARSPELREAALDVEQSARRVELSKKEKLPDFAVSAAVMPRGSIEPMWQLGFSIGLPIFAGSKQDRAVSAGEARQISQASAAEAVRQVLRLRVREREATLAALNRANQQYRTQVLVLSAASARSTLTQYEVGRVPFAAVLEALAGYIADRSSYLDSIAQAQLVAIAQREVSLDPVPSMGGAASGAMPGTSAPSRAPAAPPAEAPARSMGGM